jgi:glucokinase
LGNVPATLLNDADAAVSAEVWGNKERYGKYKNVAMITLGTGIGCGLILNGDLYQGSHGMIEAGHMMVTNSAQSRPCGCGQRGCVEAYSSAKNTVKRLQELELTDGSNSIVLDGKDVFARYQMNDYNAVKVVEEVSFIIITVVINLAFIYSTLFTDRGAPRSFINQYMSCD